MRHSKRPGVWITTSALGLVLASTIAVLRAGAGPVSSGTWLPVSTMTEPRAGASSVLLADSRVLFTGGTGTAGVLASAELFGGGGTFSATASMAVGRSGHTSVLLPDGRVLVAGGTTAAGTAIDSAELYDPASGSWVSAGTMVEPRSGHTASVLQDGRVLLAGGENGGTASATLEIYDPAQGTFTPAGTLSAARTNSRGSGAVGRPRPHRGRLERHTRARLGRALRPDHGLDHARAGSLHAADGALRDHAARRDRARRRRQRRVD